MLFFLILLIKFCLRLCLDLDGRADMWKSIGDFALLPVCCVFMYVCTVLSVYMISSFFFFVTETIYISRGPRDCYGG